MDMKFCMQILCKLEFMQNYCSIVQKKNMLSFCCFLANFSIIIQKLYKANKYIMQNHRWKFNRKTIWAAVQTVLWWSMIMCNWSRGCILHIYVIYHSTSFIYRRAGNWTSPVIVTADEQGTNIICHRCCCRRGYPFRRWATAKPNSLTLFFSSLAFLPSRK